MLRYIFLLFLVSFFNLFSQNYTEYQVFQLNALSGLDKFGVYIWETDSLLVEEGLTEDSLLIFVKNNLALPDSSLLSFIDASKMNGSPSLEVEAKTIVSADNSSVALYTAVRFIQDVILDRERSIRHYSGITWEADSLAIVPRYLLAEKTHGAILKLLDDFSTDYFYINPPDTTSIPADTTRVDSLIYD